ncbi:MAG: hypothetical protein D3911_06700 [Candidatus Electrothrix sp. AW3_4]|nr:hypothetical protein [Candidatus Electrothrix gigas]
MHDLEQIIGRIQKMVGKEQDKGEGNKGNNREKVLPLLPHVQKNTASVQERALLLVQLWQAEQVQEIQAISLGPDFLDPVVLELHAKASYRVLKEEGRQTEPAAVHHFIDCWLSFLFHPEVFRSFRSLPSFPDTEESNELYRLELLENGQSMVQKYAEQQVENGEQFIRHWEEDYVLLKLLAQIKKEEGKAEEVPLYTPGLAWQAGIADKIFTLVQGWQDACVDQGTLESYLAAGAWYSPVGSALVQLREKGGTSNELIFFQEKFLRDVLQQKERQTARKKTEQKPQENVELFFSYGLARLNIVCGINALNQGQYKKAEKILTDLLPLPPHAIGLEQELLAALQQEDRYLDLDQLMVCVHVLTALHKHSPTKAVKKLLCSLLTHQAVLLHNKGRIDHEELLHSMEEAIRLNPDDTFARMTFEDAQMDAEIFSLHQTMSAGRLDKASRIAKKSSYQGVVDQFFIFAAQVVEQVQAGDYPDDASAFFMMQQLLEGALQVDPEHQMIREITLFTEELEEQLEKKSL